VVAAGPGPFCRPDRVARASAAGAVRPGAAAPGVALALTPTEWSLLAALAALAAAPGRVFSRYELVNRVHGYEFAGYERTIDSHVKNLRRKIGSSGSDIVQTVLGVGYRLGLRRDR
jgi:DNA-binding response OmpR family regulator